MFSFDALFELGEALLVIGSGRGGVGVAIGFVDLHVLDVGVVLRVRRNDGTGRVVGGVAVLVVVGDLLAARPIVQCLK